MKTEGGAVQVFDARQHFFSQRFLLQFARALPTSEHVSLGRRWVQDMDQHGVECVARIATHAADVVHRDLRRTAGLPRAV
jgi:hypothetical protein